MGEGVAGHQSQGSSLKGHRAKDSTTEETMPKKDP